MKSHIVLWIAYVIRIRVRDSTGVMKSNVMNTEYQEVTHSVMDSLRN